MRNKPGRSGVPTFEALYRPPNPECPGEESKNLPCTSSGRQRRDASMPSRFRRETSVLIQSNIGGTGGHSRQHWLTFNGHGRGRTRSAASKRLTSHEWIPMPIRQRPANLPQATRAGTLRTVPPHVHTSMGSANGAFNPGGREEASWRLLQPCSSNAPLHALRMKFYRHPATLTPSQTQGWASTGGPLARLSPPHLSSSATGPP